MPTNEMPTLGAGEPTKKPGRGSLLFALLMGAVGGDLAHGVRKPDLPTLPDPVAATPGLTCVQFGSPVGQTADGRPVYQELCSADAAPAPVEVELANPALEVTSPVESKVEPKVEPGVQPVVEPKPSKRRHK